MNKTNKTVKTKIIIWQNFMPVSDNKSEDFKNIKIRIVSFHKNNLKTSFIIIF